MAVLGGTGAVLYKYLKNFLKKDFRRIITMAKDGYATVNLLEDDKVVLNLLAEKLNLTQQQTLSLAISSLAKSENEKSEEKNSEAASQESENFNAVCSPTASLTQEDLQKFLIRFPQRFQKI